MGIDEWLKLARELGKSAVGAQEIARDDIAAFMTFAAGFLTDFRFINTGVAFGDKGLAFTLDGMEQRGVGDPSRLEVWVRTTRFRRNFQKMSVDAYLATHIDTNRWWRFPLIHFETPTGVEDYRPPVLTTRSPDQTVSRSLRVIERLLQACNGHTTTEQAVNLTVAEFAPEDARDLRKLCDLVLASLSVRGLLS